MQISKFKHGEMIERCGSFNERTLLEQIGVIDRQGIETATPVMQTFASVVKLCPSAKGL
jgi:hypothetical protein